MYIEDFQLSAHIQEIATTTKPKYIDTKVKKNKKYYYKIKSIYSNTKLNSNKTPGIRHCNRKIKNLEYPTILSVNSTKNCGIFF